MIVMKVMLQKCGARRLIMIEHMVCNERQTNCASGAGLAIDTSYSLSSSTLIDAYAILPFLAEVVLSHGEQLMENTTISLSACQDKVVFHWQSHQQV